MSKTKPIGVRFDEDLLSELKEKNYADSPQKVLNYLVKFWRDRQGLIGAFNHLDELPVSKTPGTVRKEDIEGMTKQLGEMAKPVEKKESEQSAFGGMSEWEKIRRKKLGI